MELLGGAAGWGDTAWCIAVILESLLLVRVVGIACVGGTLLGTLGTLVHSSLHYWSGGETVLGCSDGTFGTGALLVLVLEHCLCGWLVLEHYWYQCGWDSAWLHRIPLITNCLPATAPCNPDEDPCVQYFQVLLLLYLLHI